MARVAARVGVALACAALLASVTAARTAASAQAPTALRLHRLFSDSMVLEHTAPAVFGWAPPSATVTVTVTTPQTRDVVHARHLGDVAWVPREVVTASANATTGFWRADLKPRASSMNMPAVSITVSSSSIAGPGASWAPAAAQSLSLADVLYGDVTVCSGQSNMEFAVAEMFAANDTIATAGSFAQHLRLFAVQKNASATAVDDIIDSQMPGGGWVRSEPANVCGAEYHTSEQYCEPHCGPSAAVKSFKRDTWGFFSAVCFVHGRSLLALTGRPQGLLESCWGGTSVQRWSSPEALAKCTKASGNDAVAMLEAGGGSSSESEHAVVHEGAAVGAPSARVGFDSDAGAGGSSTLFYGMIAPLLRFPITRAIWYQGEANSGSLASANAYACQLPAMITDWRARWAGGSSFDFITHQLSAYNGSATVPVLRWSQTATLALPNTGLSIGIDLADPTSPCGNVHIRNKTAVGQRVAAAAAGVAGDSQQPYQGPTLTSVSASSPTTQSLVVNLTFTTHGAGALVFKTVPIQTRDPSWQGFEVLHAASGTCDGTAVARASVPSTWVRVPAALASATRVSLHVPTALHGGCAGAGADTDTDGVTTSVTGIRYAWATAPDGQLLYDAAGFPAQPFVLDCSAGVHACAPVAPGKVTQQFV